MDDGIQETTMSVDSRPNPDPTILTTEQLARSYAMLLREIESSGNLAEAKINGVLNSISIRIDGIEKVISLFHSQTDVYPVKLKTEICHLQDLHEEKFNAIAKQFQERDIRTEQTSRDNKLAIDAALQAAKEAVDAQNKSNALAVAKSEATFTKQIDQIVVLVNSMGKGFDDKIDDNKTRLQALESQKKGAGDVWAIWLAMTGLAIGLVGSTVTVILFVFRTK